MVNPLVESCRGREIPRMSFQPGTWVQLPGICTRSVTHTFYKCASWGLATIKECVSTITHYVKKCLSWAWETVKNCSDMR